MQRRDESPLIQIWDEDDDAALTSAMIDFGLWQHLRIISDTDDQDEFDGVITITGLLSADDDEGAIEDSGTDYKQYGVAHTLDTIEVYMFVPRKIKVAYTGRTAGTISLWIQGFNDGAR